MEKIVRKHEKILNHLLRLRQNDPNLYFVPRIKNNKNRLELGYWFRGNEEYLNFSFWNGNDSLEKVYNIGIVVYNDDRTCIEFSAQDSDQKALFLKKLVDALTGFEKDQSKDKWYLWYDGKDYLANINIFIQKAKPVIDNLIKEENPIGISLLDKSIFDSYYQRIIEIKSSQINLDLIQNLEAEKKENEKGNLKNTEKIKVFFNSESEYDPLHNQMQNKVYQLLESSLYYKEVIIEKGWVDIKAQTQNGNWHYFELKIDNPKLSIRKALGQIMEYAYFPNTEKAEKLIIVSDQEPDLDTIRYLDYMRERFKLPIAYRHFDKEKNELSKDY